MFYKIFVVLIVAIIIGHVAGIYNLRNTKTWLEKNVDVKGAVAWVKSIDLSYDFSYGMDEEWVREDGVKKYEKEIKK